MFVNNMMFMLATGKEDSDLNVSARKRRRDSLKWNVIATSMRAVRVCSESKGLFSAGGIKTIPRSYCALRNRGKTPGRFGDRPYRSAFGCQQTAELRALRSDGERMLHLRARTFAPLTALRPNCLNSLENYASILR
jgi:hypothetical protein